MVDIAVDDTIILAALKTEAFTLDIGGCAWPDLSVLYFLARPSPNIFAYKDDVGKHGTCSEIVT